MPYKNPEQRRAYAKRRYHEIRQGDRTVSVGGCPRAADDIVCDHCKRAFYRSPANRLDRGQSQYCSRDCMASAFVGRFVGEKSPRWNGRECRLCDHCGDAVSRPSWSWSNRSLTFCNVACFASWKSEHWNGENNPSWVGGHPLYYGPNWIRQARKARQRDRQKCCFCMIEESKLRRALDVHHIKPFRLYGLAAYRAANHLDNLVSLCERCHTFLERFSEAGVITEWAQLEEAGRRHLYLRRIASAVRIVAAQPAGCF